MSTVTGVVAYIKNVSSHTRNTDSDMSSRSAAGKLFYTVGPLTDIYSKKYNLDSRQLSSNV